MKPKLALFTYIIAGVLCAATTKSFAADPPIAGTQVPFNGIVSGNIYSTTPVDECHLLIEAT
jgi:hypothetical protein